MTSATPEIRSWLVPFYGHTLLVQAITFVLRPTAIYKAIELDVPIHYLGAMGASFAIVPLALAVPSGQATDRFGERRVMLVGSVITLASAAGFTLLGGTVWGLLAASVLLGTGHLCSVVGQQALVANRTSRHLYDTAFGRYTFAASAGQAIGPGLIIIFGGRSSIPDTQTIFYWTIALGAVLLVTSLMLPSGPHSESTTAQPTGSIRELLRRRGLLRALTVELRRPGRRRHQPSLPSRARNRTRHRRRHHRHSAHCPCRRIDDLTLALGSTVRLAGQNPAPHHQHRGIRSRHGSTPNPHAALAPTRRLGPAKPDFQVKFQAASPDSLVSLSMAFW